MMVADDLDAQLTEPFGEHPVVWHHDQRLDPLAIEVLEQVVEAPAGAAAAYARRQEQDAAWRLGGHVGSGRADSSRS